MSPSSLVNITYGERMDARKRGAVVQPKSQTKPYATAASTGDAQPLMDVRIPFSPSIGASPDFTWNYRNSARGSPDVKLQSPGLICLYDVNFKLCFNNVLNTSIYPAVVHLT